MVKIENLVKQYDDFNLEINMQIKPGMVTGLVGRNGAGKSTTIKAILGLIAPTSGSVKIFDVESKNFSSELKNNIGVALANTGFNSGLTITAIARILKGLYKDFDKEDFFEKCRHYELPLNKEIKSFSTGMNARLRVLIALCHNAKLLILDEPTSGLDVIARNEVLDMLREYLAEDSERSILISSHISSDLEGLCDDIYMIHNGKIVLHEDTDKLLGEYALMKVNENQFENLDKQYILSSKKENFGYSCFTNQKQYYKENYPDVVIENGNIDDLIIMMSEEK